MNDKSNKTPHSEQSADMHIDIKKAIISILKCAVFILLWRLCVTTVNLVHQYINIAADAERYKEILIQNQGILIITAALMFFIAVFAIYAATGNRISDFLPVKKSKPIHFIAAVVLGVSLQCTIRMTVSFFSNGSILENLSDSFGMDSNTLWINILSIGIMVPLLEETLYRGLIFLRLKKTIKIPLAALISSIIFALSHTHIIAMIYSFIIGMLFSIILARRNNILLVITSHAFFNLSSFIAAYAVPSGYIPNFIVYIIYVVAVQGAAVILIKNSNTDKQQTAERINKNEAL